MAALRGYAAWHRGRAAAAPPPIGSGSKSASSRLQQQYRAAACRWAAAALQQHAAWLLPPGCQPVTTMITVRSLSWRLDKDAQLISCESVATALWLLGAICIHSKLYESCHGTGLPVAAWAAGACLSARERAPGCFRQATRS